MTALRSSCALQANWAAAFEAGHVTTFEVDVATGAMAFSAPCETLLGAAVCSLESFAGRVRKAQRASLMETLARAGRDAVPFASEFQLRPPARMKWASLVGAPVHVVGNETVRLHGVLADVTERKRLEASLQSVPSRRTSAMWTWRPGGISNSR